MKRSGILGWTAVALAAFGSGCGKDAGGPTEPSPATSFLEGTWNGNLTIERLGEPTTSGATAWTFQAVAGTNLQSFRVTIRSQHSWLPIETTVTSSITPSSQPPARVSTQGPYQSPR